MQSIDLQWTHKWSAGRPAIHLPSLTPHTFCRWLLNTTTDLHVTHPSVPPASPKLTCVAVSVHGPRSSRQSGSATSGISRENHRQQQKSEIRSSQATLVLLLLLCPIPPRRSSFTWALLLLIHTLCFSMTCTFYFSMLQCTRALLRVPLSLGCFSLNENAGNEFWYSETLFRKATEAITLSAQFT